MQRPILIAEIGCVHLGSLERAKMLAKLAKDNGADILKTQKRNPIESVPKDMQTLPHPNPHFAYGDTYLEHRENLELSIEEHTELKRYCEEIEIEYSTSVWDITSATEVIQLNPKSIKIPSAQNSNFKLLDYVYENFIGDVFLSLGMTTKQERLAIDHYLKDKKEKTVVFHCTSLYPCPFEKLYLYEIKKIAEKYPRYACSDHSLGIVAPITAFLLGCQYIEKHFCDDRTVKNTDAVASLEPGALSKLRRDLDNTFKALAYRPEKMDEEELEQRLKLRGS